MTALDGHLFAQLCHALAEIPRLESKIAETGDVVVTPNGAIQRHPYTVMLRETRNDVAKLSQRFGLSPADRARVPATKKPDDPDPMGKFF